MSFWFEYSICTAFFLHHSLYKKERKSLLEVVDGILLEADLRISDCDKIRVLLSPYPNDFLFVLMKRPLCATFQLSRNSK